MVVLFNSHWYLKRPRRPAGLHQRGMPSVIWIADETLIAIIEKPAMSG